MNTITTTNFNFPNQKSVYKGKVREVYNINDEILVMVATDRLSAFDVVLPKESLIKDKFSIKLQQNSCI
jgi:phosphoribosylaminoimidazole-succinocarboxamide synthase